MCLGSATYVIPHGELGMERFSTIFAGDVLNIMYGSVAGVKKLTY